ncbi:MAG: MMPL family transporter [Acidobacteriota bacterium]
MRLARGAGAARAVVRLGHRCPRIVLAGAVLTILAGVLVGTRLSFDTDILSLMPRRDPVVQNFRRTLAEFGTLDTLLVAVRVGGEERLEPALQLVDSLAEQLAASPHLTNVQARLEDPARLADAVLRHACLFLDGDGLDALGSRLSPVGLAARAADIRAGLEAPHGMLAKEFAIRDPLGLLPFLLGRLTRAPAALKVDFSSGYYLAADHSLVLVLAKPRGPAQDIDFDRLLIADVSSRIEAARAELAAELEVPLAEVPEVVLGGGHRIGLEDATLIRRDIMANSVSSLAGVMLLFFLAYRRLATTQFAFLPLAVGLALTFVFTGVALGRLSSATSAFAALLVGLGIDFTIVLYGRYLEARLSGLELAPALDVMATQSGPAVMLGAVTTVGTFYSFLATRFVGLQELGLLTGTGIVLMALSSFLLLPALITVFDRGAPRPHSAWLNPAPLLGWAGRHRRLVLVAVAAVTVAAAATLPSVRFDDDVRHLRSPANRGVAVQEEVARAFGLSFNAMMVRIEGRDAQQVLERVRVLEAGLVEMEAAGLLASHESLGNLLPPLPAQQRALSWLAEHRELTDPRRVREALVAAMVGAGLAVEAFAPGLENLESTLRPAGAVSFEVWRGTPVEQVVERSLRESPGQATTIVNVFPPPGRWRREAPPELVKLVSSVPGASLTGVNLISQRLRRTVWQDAALAGGLGLGVVFLMLLWELRGLRPALVCLLPVGVGVIWMVGTMGALGFPLNLLNVFVITMVIGVGVDYGIHMLHRVRDKASEKDLGETARAVILAALTTIVGFGSLVTTHYPGLQSIGWMTSLGVTYCCLLAVVVLPLIVRVEGR